MNFVTNARTRISKKFGASLALLTFAAVSVAFASTSSAAVDDLATAPGQALLKYKKGSKITISGDLKVKSSAIFNPPPNVVNELHFDFGKSCKLGSSGGSCISNSSFLDAKAFKTTAHNSADAKTDGAGTVSALAAGNSVSVDIGFGGQFLLEAQDFGAPCTHELTGTHDCVDTSTSSAIGEISTSSINGSDPVAISIPFTVRSAAQMLGSASIFSLAGACLNLDASIKGTWSVSGVSCSDASGVFELGAIGVDNESFACNLSPGEYTLNVAYEGSWVDRVGAACCQQFDADGCAVNSGFNVNLAFQPSTGTGN